MMTRDQAEILVVSVPNKERLVGELWFDNEQWATLTQQESQLLLEFYPRLSGQPWSFRCEDAVDCLKELRSRLLEEPSE